MEKIADNYGSLRGIEGVPEWMQNIYVTAMDIHWSDHLMAQSVWQKWIGNAIAKTINMPYDVTTEDVKPRSRLLTQRISHGLSHQVV